MIYSQIFYCTVVLLALLNCNQAKQLSSRSSKDAEAGNVNFEILENLQKKMYKNQKQAQASAVGNKTESFGSISRPSELLSQPSLPVTNPNGVIKFAMKKQKGATHYMLHVAKCESQNCECQKNMATCPVEFSLAGSKPLSATRKLGQTPGQSLNLAQGKDKYIAFAIASAAESGDIVAGLRFFINSGTVPINKLNALALKIFDVPMSLNFDLSKSFTFSVAPEAGAEITPDKYHASVNQELCTSSGCVDDEVFSISAGADGKFILPATDERMQMLNPSAYKVAVFAEKQDETGNFIRSENSNLTFKPIFTLDYEKIVQAIELDVLNIPLNMAFSSKSGISFKVKPKIALAYPIDSYLVNFYEVICSSGGCFDNEILSENLADDGEFRIPSGDQKLQTLDTGTIKVTVRAVILDQAGLVYKAKDANLTIEITYDAGCAASGVEALGHCYFLGTEMTPANSATSGEGENCQEACTRFGLSYDDSASRLLGLKSNHGNCLQVAKVFIPEIQFVRAISSANTTGKYGCGLLTDNAMTISGGAEAYVTQINGSSENADVDAITRPRFIGQARICGCQ